MRDLIYVIDKLRFKDEANSWWEFMLGNIAI